MYYLVVNDSWTRNGISNLMHLILEINHSKKYKTIITFQFMRKTNIVASLSTVYAENIHKHNKWVKKN